MARPTPVRDQLLTQIHARQRAAGQKVSRLERKGLKIRQAGYDPRQSQSAISEMSTRQLRGYLNHLNNFTSRSNSYVAGRNGVPLSGQLFREYKKREAQHNKNARGYLEKIRDVKIPGLGVTVGQRMNNIAQGPRAGGDFRTFDLLDRNPSGLTSDDSIKALLKGIDKKLQPKYFEKEMKNMRKVLGKMLSETGNEHMIETVNDLSDDQLNVLTGYTDFMNQVGFRYDVAKSVSEDTPRFQSAVYETAGGRADELVKWATGLNIGNISVTPKTAKPKSPKLKLGSKWAGTIKDS